MSAEIIDIAPPQMEKIFELQHELAALMVKHLSLPGRGLRFTDLKATLVFVLLAYLRVVAETDSVEAMEHYVEDFSSFLYNELHLFLDAYGVGLVDDDTD